MWNKGNKDGMCPTCSTPLNQGCCRPPDAAPPLIFRCISYALGEDNLSMAGAHKGAGGKGLDLSSAATRGQAVQQRNWLGFLLGSWAGVQ
jgi:hypothetical protein